MSDTHADSAHTERLLERAATGDAQAFDELFARHQPFLRQLVDLRLDQRLRARVDPSDVVQDAHLEAFRRLEVFLEKRPMPFRLWLRQIACDQSLKARRRHFGTARRSLAREAVLPDQSSIVFAERLLARTASPSQNLERRDLQRRLHTAMAKLSESDYELILMRHFEGLSNQEAAVVLGIDAASASKRHGRAMLRLHKILF